MLHVKITQCNRKVIEYSIALCHIVIDLNKNRKILDFSRVDKVLMQPSI